MSRKSMLGSLALVLVMAAVGCNPQTSSLDSLTDEQQATLNNALAQLGSLGGLAASTFGAAAQSEPDAKPVNAVIGGEACPAITIALDQTQFSIDFDFGDACTPALYPDVVLSGSIGGTIVFANRSLEVTMENFSNGEKTATGTATLAFENSPDDTTVDFTASASLDVEESGSANVDTEWSVAKETGVITIAIVEGQATSADEVAYDLSCESLVLDAASNGNFVPQSGTSVLTVEEDNGMLGTRTTTITVTFDENSPVDGTVSVQINEGEPFEHVLEGFEGGSGN